MGCFPGLPNLYGLIPVKKMSISPTTELLGHIMPNPLSGVSVLYNPKSYKRTAMMRPGHEPKKDEDPKQQTGKGRVVEIIEVDFFLDTFSAGIEIVGTSLSKALDGLKFEGNAILPSAAKLLDVNTYVDQIYGLCFPNPKEHSPAVVSLNWGSSLEFNCILGKCSVTYTKFKETGIPVRAIMHCVFQGVDTVEEQEKLFPDESPDTSKFHTLVEGETLNDISMIAYDNPGSWRPIAQANGIKNPRILRTGQTIHMPAL